MSNSVFALSQYFQLRVGKKAIMHSSMLNNPQDITIIMPGNPKLRLYFFDAKEQHGTHMTEFHFVDTTPSVPCSFNHINTNFVIPIGYYQDYDIFVIWDVSQNKNWNNRKSLHIRTSDIIETYLLSKQNHPNTVCYGEECVLISKATYLYRTLSKKIDLVFEELVK